MIRKINVDEIYKIIDIEKEAFNDCWSLKVYEELYKSYTTDIYVYEKNGMCIAYVVFLDMIDVYELVRIAVKTEFRGQKIASKLLENSIEKLEKNIFLEVRENNCDAISLYTKKGFKIINIRKNYYQDTGENALIMNYEK